MLNFNAGGAFYDIEEIPIKRFYKITNEHEGYQIMAIPDKELGLWKIDASFRSHRLHGEPWTHHEKIPFSRIADENDIRKKMYEIINNFS